MTDTDKLAAAAAVIGMPFEQWPGRCTAVATALVNCGSLPGTVVYGTYHGEISPDSCFSDRLFTHHSWIETDTEIIDPSRWVFESRAPYIYRCPLDNPEYDRGSNVLTEMLRAGQRPPQYCEHMPVHQIPAQFGDLVRMNWPEQLILTDEQLGWLASSPLSQLGDRAEPFFRWLIEQGMGALIPTDNRTAVLNAAEDSRDTTNNAKRYADYVAETLQVAELPPEEKQDDTESQSAVACHDG